VGRERRPAPADAAHDSHAADPPRASSAAVLAILLAALALRLWHLREGLPDFVDEAFPFRRAFEMWGWSTGRADWNPHVFHYPSLSFYLHFMLQRLQYVAGHAIGLYPRPADWFLAYQTDPTPMVMLARLVGVAADLAMLAGVAVIGERVRRGAGLAAAALLAVSPVLIRGTRTIGTDAPMAALALWALERMLAYRATGRLRALAAAAVLLGLAAGTKYPAALLVVPLAWASWTGRGRRDAVRFAGAVALAAAVFLLTSPFLPFELARLGADATKIANLLGAGQLGSFDRGGAFGSLRMLASGLGVPGLLLLALSPWLAARAAREPGTRLGLWQFVLAFAVPVLLARVSFERYVVPVLPAGAVLAALAAFAIGDRIAGRARGPVLAALLAALVLVPALDGVRAAAAGRDTTQSQARRWIEANVSRVALVVEEEYAAPLRSCPDSVGIVRSRWFGEADVRGQHRWRAQRTLHAVTIPLVVGGPRCDRDPARGRAAGARGRVAQQRRPQPGALRPRALRRRGLRGDERGRARALRGRPAPLRRAGLALSLARLARRARGGLPLRGRGDRARDRGISPARGRASCAAGGGDGPRSAVVGALRSDECPRRARPRARPGRRGSRRAARLAGQSRALGGGTRQRLHAAVRAVRLRDERPPRGALAPARGPRVRGRDPRDRAGSRARARDLRRDGEARVTRADSARQRARSALRSARPPRRRPHLLFVPNRA
jgi:hypothetical protein